VPVAAPELIAPTFEWCPPAASSDLGQEAAELAASAGLLMDPWQVYALDRILAEQADGVPAAFEAGLVVPRQNGKGSVLEALSLAWLFLTEAPLILHSAHEFKTARQRGGPAGVRGGRGPGVCVGGDCGGDPPPGWAAAC
jgi:hypothetical protein